MNCQHCQTLLLDHLYGLLDAGEVAAVDAHLAACPQCAAARDETARVQGLIARAAKSAFPAAKFEPPAAQPSKAVPGGAPVPASPAPAGGKDRARSRRVAEVFPWAVAAAVLIAIPSTVIPVRNLFRSADGAAREAEIARLQADAAEQALEAAKAEPRKALSDAEFRLAAAEQARAALLHKWAEEQKAAAQTAGARTFSVDVLKPATVQPGAPNDFVVVVNDRRPLWEATGKRMVAEVHAVDASDAVIFSQPLNVERTGERRHALRLPASAWAKVRPDSELFLVVAQVDEKTQARTELQERVRLAGPVFATLLTTDKAAYRPGERLFFRSLTLDRVTFRPPAREQLLKYELLRPGGRAPAAGLSVTGTTDLVTVGAGGQVAPVLLADGKPVRGVGCGEFVLPPDLPDGDYLLRLSEGQYPGGLAPTLPVPVTRTVKVRTGADNYRKEVHFAKESFAPGEAVEAWAELKFEGKPVPGAAVAGVFAEVDRAPLGDIEFAKATGADGRAKLRFQLPAEVRDGDVRLKVAFRTPRGDEAVAARVPVVGSRVAVEFFPEGGDLVAGVRTRVYVRATTPAGRPVNFRGVVTDGRQDLATVESFNDPDRRGANRGLASFTFTPELGTRVWLKLESPAGAFAPVLPGVPVQSAAVALLGGPGAAAARTGFLLPEAKAEGVVMSVLDPVTAPGEPIRVKLHSVGQPRRLVVGAYTRGKLGDTQKVTVEPESPQTLKLMAGPDPRGGVVRVTAFEEQDDRPDLKPVAERLVFRKPGEVLNLALAANGAELFGFGATRLAAGSEVSLAVTATDEKGNPAAAVLWAAAVNSGVAPGAKDRDLPTHFLLAGEVKSPDDLEYADFLLTNRPKAAEALDLLLGTQGWRRFAEQQAPAPAAVHAGRQPYYHAAPPPDVAKLMVRNGQYAAWAEPAPVRHRDELRRKFEPRYEAAAKAAERAKAALAQARASARDPAGGGASAAADDARRAAAEKAERAEAAREPVRRFRANAWYGVAGLVALALACGQVALRRPAGRLPLGVSTLGAAALAAFLVVASGWGREAKADAQDATAAPAPTPGDRGENPAPGAAPPAAPTRSELQAGVGRRADRLYDPDAPMAAGGMTVRPQAKDGRGFREYPSAFGAPKAGATKFVAPAATAPAAPSAAPPAPAPLPAALPALPAERSMGAAGPGLAAGFGAGAGLAEADGARRWSSPFLRKRSAAASGEEARQLKQAADLALKYAKERGATPAKPAASASFNNGPKSKAAPADALAEKELEALGLYHAGGPPDAAPLVVREFAAPRPAPVALADAEDEPDTVLWRPVIVLPSDGKAVLNFAIGSAPGGYEVVVAGHTADGRLGAARGMILVAPARTETPATPPAPGGAVAPPAPGAPNPPPAP